MLNFTFKLINKIARMFYIDNEILLLQKFTEQYCPNVCDQNIKKVLYSDLDGLDRKLSFRLKKELDEGSIIYGYFIENELAHYSCITNTKHKIGEVNCMFQVPSNYVYIYNCYTIFEHRGKGLYTKMLQYLSGIYSNTYIAVLSNNKASLHVIEKVGFEKYARIHFTKLLFKRLIITDKTIEPYITPLGKS